MNKQRRNTLNAILDGLERLRDPVGKEEAVKILQDAQSQVMQCADEEEAALDNRPESFRWSAENDMMADNIADLSDAGSDLEILADRCQHMETYDYGLVRGDIINIVNTIKRTIHR